MPLATVIVPAGRGLAAAVTLLALISQASLLTAQPREWRTLRPRTLLHLTVERDSAVWAFVAIDSARLDLRGPCIGNGRFECPQVRSSIPLVTVGAAWRRTDRVIEGTLLGAGVGAAVGALGYLARAREEQTSLGPYSTPVVGVIGAVVGGIIGSRSYRWVRLPLPGG